MVSNLPVLAILTGLLLHQCFRLIELDRYPLTILGAVVAAHWTLAFGLQYQDVEHAFLQSQKVAFSTVALGVLSMWISMLIYRAFLHPLHNFPGPFAAKLTKWWAFKELIASKVRWYQVVGKMHEEYGDYIRTGPRELTIIDPAALDPILGVTSKLRKSPMYNGMRQSLHTTRDHEWHRQRRKVWDVAFKHTLADYGPCIEDFTGQLLANIAANLGEAVRINDLASYYSYDVMSTLGFGEPANYLKGTPTAAASQVLADIRKGIIAMGVLLHAPYLITMMEELDVGMTAFNNWSRKAVQKRRLATNSRPDIVGHFIKHADDTPAGDELLFADARVVIGAGSDTTTSALSCLFVALAARPDIQTKLRAEVRVSFQNGEYSCGKPQPFLDGIIYETLRLWPPVTFGTQRISPPEGMVIGNVRIPGDTVLWLPSFQLMRDKRSFVQPNDFIPERWTTQPELVLNKSAWLPFSAGVYNCPGKALGMMELRSVVARTIDRFNVSFPPGVDFKWDAFYSEIKDCFTSGVPNQDLVFSSMQEGVS